MLTCRSTTSPRAKFNRKAPERICAICAALHGSSRQSRPDPADSHSTASVPNLCHASVSVRCMHLRQSVCICANGQSQPMHLGQDHSRQRDRAAERLQITVAPAQLPHPAAHPIRDRVLAVRGQCRLTTWAWLSMWVRSCSVLVDVKPMTCRETNKCLRHFQQVLLQVHRCCRASSLGSSQQGRPHCGQGIGTAHDLVLRSRGLQRKAKRGWWWELAPTCMPSPVAICAKRLPMAPMPTMPSVLLARVWPAGWPRPRCWNVSCIAARHWLIPAWLGPGGCCLPAEQQSCMLSQPQAALAVSHSWAEQASLEQASRNVTRQRGVCPDMWPGIEGCALTCGFSNRAVPCHVAFPGRAVG